MLRLTESMRLSETKQPWWLLIIISLTVFFTASYIGSVVVMMVFIALFPTQIKDILTDPNMMMLISLYSFPFVTLGFIVIHKFVYHQSFAELGIRKKGFLKNYGLGALLGTLFVSLIFLVNILLQNMIVESVHDKHWGMIAVLVFLFMIQGFTEELYCRGFLMNKLAPKIGVVLAIVTNSLVFSLLHIMNPEVNVLVLFNLFLAGLMFSLIFYYTDNLWLTGAIHSFWNITISVIFGAIVSGTGVPATIFETSFSLDSKHINGGLFGIEGGLITTAFCLAVIIALWIKCLKKYKY